MYYQENTIIYFDGSFVKATDAKTNLYSQSLHYGYAVFEGIKSYQTEKGTRIFKAEEHYDRLRFSAETLQMPFTYTTSELVDLSYEVLDRNGLGDAYLRPLVISSPNMALSKGKESQLVIEAWEWNNGYLNDKMRIMTSSYRRPNPEAFHVEAKVSGHYVNSILACQEAKDKGYDEALLLDANGHVAESSGANVFFEKDGVLFTPARGNILPGITRATVIEICKKLGIQVVEKCFKPEEMRGADAAFFCGTAAEVATLASLDDVPFTGKWEDSLSSRIQKAYRNLVLGKSINEV
ncbi:branched-chain amino acid transaminase [Flavobacterium cerinum]|uniref:Branched-chain-amino-acid aminotransferase n=1 Tax=Flavobacterium cerinum TaxID=2502784 RepID=A0ABY5IQ44_9FLAO|nr:branched-chain amino acid transaminase [Flavobacterium cerinum]UUC44941.1 branched-chain amino acid transaminase [Flavobacterium cerinum]